MDKSALGGDLSLRKAIIQRYTQTRTTEASTKNIFVLKRFNLVAPLILITKILYTMVYLINHYVKPFFTGSADNSSYRRPSDV